MARFLLNKGVCFPQLIRPQLIRQIPMVHLASCPSFQILVPTPRQLDYRLVTESIANMVFDQKEDGSISKQATTAGVSRCQLYRYFGWLERRDSDNGEWEISEQAVGAESVLANGSLTRALDVLLGREGDQPEAGHKGEKLAVDLGTSMARLHQLRLDMVQSRPDALDALTGQMGELETALNALKVVLRRLQNRLTDH